jgi:kinetochore protein Mis12/MTW1
VYVESQSKRILERRGVDTRDGVEGVWDGRRVGAEEVRGLEGLVQSLGRGKKDITMEDTDAGAADTREEMDTS